MSLISRFQLQDKLLLLGVMPAAIVAIILATYLTSTRLNDMYDLLHKTNENLCLSIAKSSVNGVFSGNLAALDAVVRSVVNEPDILSIKITDSAGTALSYASSDIATPSLLSNPSKEIVQPITLKSIENTDEFDSLLVGPPVEKNETIGYVTLTLSYEAIQQRQYNILSNTIYITLFLLLVIALIAKYFSATISRPILKLTRDVKNITKGNYTPPPNTPNISSKDEIATLESGVHEMAQQINNHQRILKQRVLEATQELRSQNDKLFSAQEEILKSADAKSRFISHISHEIRTPLNGIIGFLEIIQQTPLDDEQLKLVNASHLSSKNLQTIINEVLDFTQLESGKVLIHKTNFELKKAIQDAILLLSAQAKENHVSINYQHDANVPVVINQDHVKFGQILINLLSNAIKFSHQSSVIVRLKMNPYKQDVIDISIIDHGIGISGHNLKQLFQEYSQLDGATSDQGTGLGLVITKRLLNALNGSIKVKSTLGEGSNFTFSLPFTQVKDSYQAINKPIAIEHPLPDLSSLNILVADDNEINRLLLSHLLEKQHANVTCVNDGQQAIELAFKHPYDLMLFDLRMPLKMGNEALFEIRNHSQNPNYKTPAIAITAHITSGEEKAHHISSFDGYLIKPINQVHFFALIEQLLSEHDFDTQPFISTTTNGDSASNSQPFDYHLAKKSMNADHSFMLIMLEKFLSELPKQSEDISELIGQNNIVDAAEAVHKIHGSAAYCGTPLLKSAAKKLELVLRENDKNNTQKFHKIFCNEIQTLLTLKSDILTLLQTLTNNQET